MTGWDRRDEFLRGAEGRSTLARYTFAVAASLAAVLVSAALTQDAAPLYALLVAVVAITVWYGGLRPGLVAIAVGWASKFVIVVLPGDFHGAEVTRWLAALATALGVVWVSFVLRAGRERAEVASGELGAIGQLAAGLSRATTSAEVAHVVTHEASELLGAQGAALGLVEGEEVVVVDPIGLAARTHVSGGRLALDSSTLITRAAHEGSLERANSRAELETSFADSAALLTPATQGAIAAPLRVGGQVIGSIGFVFDGENAVSDEVEALTVIVAELAGQALERTRLYERERDAHAALDRILRVAPRFHADSPEDVAEAICREARLTFGADFGVLWRVNGTRLELVRSDPAHAALPLGLAIPLDDFPELEDAVGAIRPSFVSDVQDEAVGAGLSRVRTLGIRSSLRAPIAVGGEARLVLIASWQTVVSDPDPSTVVIMRRLADQAGLAIEQVERRRAQDEAFRRGEETRRLQEVTAALSLAATATEVSSTCLEHVLAAVGADAGFVVLTNGGGSAVALAASNGYDEAGLETWWGGLSPDADLPFSRAIAGGEPVWALDAETAAELVAGPDVKEMGWLALPLRTPAGVHGAVQLAFRAPKDLSDEDRRWLESAASQCAQALARSRLFDEEQRLRLRSERLQDMTAALATALTQADVAAAAVHEIDDAVDATGVAFAVVLEDRVTTLAAQGYSEGVVEPWLEAPFDAPTPANRALRRSVSAFFESIEAIREEFPAIAGDLAATGHESFLFVPLVGGRRANGLVVVSWAERYKLSADERTFIESLVGQAAQALDRAIHFESERTIAETLQRSVLPVSLPRVQGADLAARYLPGTAELEVGGDWFDAMQLPDGRLGLVVGDVVGKGVRAAASMAQLRNALRAYSLDRMKPSSAVARLNRLAEEVLDTSFATLVYAVVDPQASVCRFTSAGHPPPLAVFADGRAEFLEGARGLPLGAGANTSYRHDTVELPAGSVLLLYTDGLVERRERPIDEGLELLRAAAADGPRDPEQLLERILRRLAGHESADDIALLAIRFLPVAPKPLRLRVPSEAGSLELIRDVLRAWFETVPLDRFNVEELVLATWEACANAIEHAREPSGEHVSVWADLSETHVRISVEDTGVWSPPNERPDRGLGLRLVRSAASSIDIDTGEKGTKVTFEKDLQE